MRDGYRLARHLLHRHGSNYGRSQVVFVHQVLRIAAVAQQRDDGSSTRLRFECAEHTSGTFTIDQTRSNHYPALQSHRTLDGQLGLSVMRLGLIKGADGGDEDKSRHTRRAGLVDEAQRTLHIHTLQIAGTHEAEVPGGVHHRRYLAAPQLFAERIWPRT